jgi:hypothetical protein
VGAGARVAALRRHPAQGLGLLLRVRAHGLPPARRRRHRAVPGAGLPPGLVAARRAVVLARPRVLLLPGRRRLFRVQPGNGGLARCPVPAVPDHLAAPRGRRALRRQRLQPPRRLHARLRLRVDAGVRHLLLHGVPIGDRRVAGRQRDRAHRGARPHLGRRGWRDGLVADGHRHRRRVQHCHVLRRPRIVPRDSARWEIASTAGRLHCVVRDRGDVLVFRLDDRRGG